MKEQLRPVEQKPFVFRPEEIRRINQEVHRSVRRQTTKVPK